MMNPSLKHKMVQLLGKMTGVMVTLQPKKMRDNLDNFVTQANNKLASMRENVLKEVIDVNRKTLGERLTSSIRNGTTKADTCQKGSLAKELKS